MRERITSRQNETIKSYSKLLSSAAARRESGLFLCEGARLCCDAAQSGVEIVAFYATESGCQRYASYCSQIEAKAQSSALISDHVAPLLSDTKNPQGVYCVCKMPQQEESVSAWALAGSYLVLEEMQDPTNLGTVLRTAEALGISGVLLTGDCCDPFGPKVVRGSMGAVFRMKLYRCDNLPQTLAELKEQGFATMAAVVDSDAVPVTKVSFAAPSVMVIGNEGNGLRQETIAACSHRVTIPMLGRAESLNASSAVSILLWEMMREKE
jgi:TrmH family RNA methyltransferase